MVRKIGTPKTMPDSNDEGTTLTPPPADSDVGQLIYLIEWGRLRGVRIGPTVQIGSITLQVTDLRQTEGRNLDEPDKGPWAAAGYDGT